MSRIVPVRLAGFAVVLASLACASVPQSHAPPPEDRNVITQAQMRALNFNTVFEAVEALRANWLVQRAPHSYVTQSIVWVYLDNTRLGGPESMRDISTTSVAYVRYLDANTATTRWGGGHGRGVIHLSSFSR